MKPIYSAWNKHKIRSSSSVRIASSGHSNAAGDQKASQPSSSNALPRTRVAYRALSDFDTSDEPLVTMPIVHPEGSGNDDHGIGILQFLHGKNYLITGATGFLGKVLVEKLLRSTGSVGTIYLMIKAANKEAAAKRLHNEIIDSELFGCLKQMYGDCYEDIMKKKLVPVVGDAGQPSLGMDANLAEEIANEVDVIVNLAANTVFDERYDVAINVNIKGPSRLLNLAKMCKRLKVFVHVSTAYANGEREGVIFEKLFRMGDSISAEKAESNGGHSFIRPLDIDDEIDLASRLLVSSEKNEVTRKMKELGLERAMAYGWRNTYEFTKAMAEMLLDSARGDIPLVIMRPSIVESTLAEPIKGWIQGNRMLDPVLVSYGKGHLPGFPHDCQSIVDIVPADIFVNAILTSMAKHGKVAKPGLNLYHVSSGVVNPLHMIDIFKHSRKYFNTIIAKGMHGTGRIMQLDEFQIFSSLESFRDYMENISKHDEFSKLASDAAVADTSNDKRHTKLQKKVMELFFYMAKMYLPYTFYKGRFDDSNIRRLIAEMSSDEKRQFRIDVEGVDWEDYFMNVHLPGLMKYVVKADARKTNIAKLIVLFQNPGASCLPVYFSNPKIMSSE